MFTTKPPGSLGTHLMDLERIKAYVGFGVTPWF